MTEKVLRAYQALERLWTKVCVKNYVISRTIKLFRQCHFEGSMTVTEDHAYQKVKFRQEVWCDEPCEGREVDFFNREEEKRRALNDLMSSSGHLAVWIVGERYAGKTSLLRLLCEKCRRANLIVLEIPWQAIQSPEAFYREYLWALDKFSDELESDGRRQFNLPNNTAFWQAIEQRRSIIDKRKLVICIDELDTILRGIGSDNQREMIGTLERLIGAGQKLIVTSTREPGSIETSAASPMVRRATVIRLYPFDDKDIDDLINAYLTVPSINIQRQIRSWSGGWPFYAKAILYHFLLLPDDVPDRFQRALSDAVNTIAPACEHLYRHHWDDNERRALLLLARQEGISAVDLHLLGLEAATAFKKLSRRGYLLQDAHNQYRFRVRLIKEWLRQWPHRELQELKLNLEKWLRVLAWRDEPREDIIRVTRDELQRSGF